MKFTITEEVHRPGYVLIDENQVIQAYAAEPYILSRIAIEELRASSVVHAYDLIKAEELGWKRK